MAFVNHFSFALLNNCFFLGIPRETSGDNTAISEDPFMSAPFSLSNKTRNKKCNLEVTGKQ